MASLRSLAKDTAIYGLSSIVGRFLNYMLTPLYTHVISAESGGYGIVTNVYAYTALILVMLTFGMETTFFRFANKEGEDPRRVFSTALSFVSALSVTFFLLVYLFLPQVSGLMGYASHQEYVLLMAAVVMLDAIQAIPFSYLRYRNHALRFAFLKLLFIVMNISLNLVYFLVLGYDDVLGVFALNLLCTSVITLFFVPDVLAAFAKPDMRLLGRMLAYSWPILVLGIAGILNQAADKILFPLVYPDREQGIRELAVYGGCVKVAMIMAMITQAFRFAYEPFVFAQSQAKDRTGMYAQGMKYFFIFTLLAFLCVMAYMPVLRYMLGSDYWQGLGVVPIVMVAEIMMGIYFNLSFWYKLVDKTIYGAWFSLAGCVVLVAVNVVFIPRYSYMACAWGGVAGYGTSMLLSYLVGQRLYPIAYPLGDMARYAALTALLTFAVYLVPEGWPLAYRLALNTLCVLALASYILYRDIPVSNLPLVGRYFRTNNNSKTKQL